MYFLKRQLIVDKVLNLYEKKEIKFSGSNSKYSIIIGNNSLSYLPGRIKSLCPNTKSIALIIDKKVPNKFKKIFEQKLKNYNLFFSNLMQTRKTNH